MGKTNFTTKDLVLTLASLLCERPQAGSLMSEVSHRGDTGDEQTQAGAGVNGSSLISPQYLGKVYISAAWYAFVELNNGAYNKGSQKLHG